MFARRCSAGRAPKPFDDVLFLLICRLYIFHHIYLGSPQRVLMLTIPVFFSLFASICRLINLVADDNAIEDTIYHLHRALSAGRIDLEKFLRVSGIFSIVFFQIPLFRLRLF